MMPQYEVTLTLKFVIEARNGMAAETEAIDLLHMVPATVVARTTCPAVSQYMKS
jgi:hypothetical protein